MKTLKFIILLVTLLSLSSCDKVNTDQLKGSVDRTNKPIVTTIHFYDTVEEVQTKFKEIHNLPKNHNTNVLGFAQWPEFKDANGKPMADDNQQLTCVIHTLRPKKIDDEATLTLGHEMLHCVIGTYH